MGAATEANNANGVEFFSPRGDLLGVVFDDVAEKSDAQKLEFNRYRVEVKVKGGRVSQLVEDLRKARTA